jgi:radical SAM superfamily enzyme YgiQ (UPF0313 family)
MSHTPKIALIICPCWDIEFPPYGISLLSGILSKSGIENTCFDFNQLFHKATSSDGQMWDQTDQYTYWANEKNIDKIFTEYEDIIEFFLDQLTPFEMIGFSIFTLNSRFSVRLAQLIRQRFPEKVLIAGGPECNIIAGVDYLIEKKMFDAICKSDGEDSFPELVNKYAKEKSLNSRGFLTLQKDGRYFDFGDFRSITKIDDLAFANFDYLGAKAKNINISTSRGCIRDCAYCPEKAIWGNYSWRKAESTAKELLEARERYKNLQFVYFNDDLVNGNMRELEKMCDILIENKWRVGWGGHALVRERWTEELVSKIAKTNGQRFNFGIESGSNRVLKLMGKMFEIEQAHDLFEKLSRHKVSFSINLIIGFPGETDEDFEETRKLAHLVRRYTKYIHINPCIVLKGSDLFNNAEKWDIHLPSNFVTEWSSKDGKNTYEMRMNRARQLIAEIA